MSLLDMTYAQAHATVKADRSAQIREQVGDGMLVFYLSGGNLRLEYRPTLWNFTIVPSAGEETIRVQVLGQLASHVKSYTSNIELQVKRANTLLDLVRPGTALQLEVLELIP